MEERSENFGFIFHPSYYEAVKELPEEYRNEALAAICTYGVTGEMPQGLSAVVSCIMKLTAPTVDASKARYTASKVNGRKKKSKPEANVQQTPMPEGDLNKDKDMDKDMDTDKDTDTEANTAPASGCEEREAHGTFRNVRLTRQELADFRRACPDSWERQIELLSTYMAANGKSYENHYATLLNWAVRDRPADPDGGGIDYDAINAASEDEYQAWRRAQGLTDEEPDAEPDGKPDGKPDRKAKGGRRHG